MEDREMPRMHKYGESNMTRIRMATVRHVTSSSGHRKFQATWFLLNRVYNILYKESCTSQMHFNLIRSSLMSPPSTNLHQCQCSDLQRHLNINYITLVH